LESLYKAYGKEAAFLLVYIREAHPSDGWQTKQNVKDGVIFKQPKTFHERAKVAKACHDGLKMTIPCLVDGMDNKVDTAYGGKPDRLCVVDIDGKIAYHSKRGPWGFKPKEAEAALKEILANNGKVKIPPKSVKNK
jgi:hypothetical protein